MKLAINYRLIATWKRRKASIASRLMLGLGLTAAATWPP
jgi:hypothetical protein